ncbi:GGDEF domain-containing protein [Sulfurimonas sp. C5]|uniref:GGDEF domain-containing protein n=1 Tax=Sulfurimonas sp. C5 TaxID=3036947 RepID=UPI002457323C|nr:GGDEF domain-containing protein [Sulfurimonas sp. C5]MDH4944330.1 GGDEF domain-containing protein [Sulfurimonas sp. C5]
MIQDSTFLTIINIIPNPLIVTNGKEVVLSNQNFLDFLGLDSLDDLKKNNRCICNFFLEHPDYFSAKNLEEDEGWIDFLCKNPKGIKVSMLNSHGEGRAFEISIGRLDEYHDMYVIVFTDITSLQNEKRILEKLAYKDPLTDIYNRQIFNTMLQQAYADKQKDGAQVSLILFDIDHFKMVNDNYGHDMGDKVLIELTKIIGKNIRTSDVFARWGGEEFVILLPNTGSDAAYKKAEFLREIVENNEVEYIPKITISLGVTEIALSDKERTCFKRVDTALYKAKETRNKAVLI